MNNTPSYSQLDKEAIVTINNSLRNNLLKGVSTEMINGFDILKNIDLYIGELNDFLFHQSRILDPTNGIYYKKNGDKMNTNFRDLSKPKKGISILEIKEMADNILGKEGLSKEPLPIISSNVETFFVISGIQNMYTDSLPIDKQTLVHQPSIRLNFDGANTGAISGETGISTSFVNTTVYQKDINIKQYIENLDRFFDFLNKIGIYIGDISLKLLASPQTRKGKQTLRLVIHMFYGDLHIGDSGICEVEGIEKEANGSFFDLGFGLERLSLARNKFDNYFHQYLDNKIDLDRYSDLEIDTIKTLCLIQSQNISNLDKHSGPGIRYRKLLKNLTKNKNYYPIINIFFDYRSNFISFNNSQSEVIRNILNDIESN